MISTMCPGQFIIPQQLLQQRAERQKNHQQKRHILSCDDAILAYYWPNIHILCVIKYDPPPIADMRHSALDLSQISQRFLPENILSCFVSSLVFGKKFRKWLFQSLWQRGNIISFLRLCNSSSFKQFYARQSLKYNHERKGLKLLSILHANQPSCSS